MPCNKKRTIEQMQQIAQERGGQCLSLKYVNNHSRLRWECSKKHTWETSYKAIQRGCWCPKCSYGAAGKQRRKSIKEVQELAASRGFSLLSTEYHGSDQYLEWECESGHAWNASYNAIQSGNGCPNCWGSLPEEKCRFILEQLLRESFPKINRIDGERLQLDGYNKGLKLAFEYNGQQHYKYTPVFHRTIKRFEEQKTRDKKKLDLCKKIGIELIVIPYTEQDQLEEFIKSQLLLPVVNHCIDWSLFVGKPNKMEAIDKIIISNRGERVSDDPYENNRTPIIVECEFGHRWSTHADRLQRGCWCYKCSNRDLNLYRIGTLDYLDELYNKKNLTALEIRELLLKDHCISASKSAVRNLLLDRGIELKTRWEKAKASNP